MSYQKIDAEVLRRMWPLYSPLEIACRFNCSVSRVKQVARSLGLKSIGSAGLTDDSSFAADMRTGIAGELLTMTD